MRGSLIFKVILISFFPLLLSSKCQFDRNSNLSSSNQYIKGVSFVLDQGRPLNVQKQKITIKSLIYLKNGKLPSMKAAILKQNSLSNPQEVYGNLTIKSAGLEERDPYHEITLELDLRKIFHEVERVNVKEVKLPNGKVLAFSEKIIESGKMVLLKVEGIESQVYLYAGQNEILAGFSFGLEELDSIGLQVGKSEYCPEFQFDGILGIAGIYTGPNKGENGLLFIANLSSVISPQTLRTNSRDIASLKNNSQDIDLEKLRYSFSEPGPISASKLYQIRKLFYQLIHKGGDLHYIKE